MIFPKAKIEQILKEFIPLVAVLPEEKIAAIAAEIETISGKAPLRVCAGEPGPLYRLENWERPLTGVRMFALFVVCHIPDDLGGWLNGMVNSARCDEYPLLLNEEGVEKWYEK